MKYNVISFVNDCRQQDTCINLQKVNKDHCKAYIMVQIPNIFFVFLLFEKNPSFQILFLSRKCCTQYQSESVIYGTPNSQK